MLAASAAPLIAIDGTLHAKHVSSYVFGECGKHRAILDHARELALSLGIRVGKVGSRPSFNPFAGFEVGPFDYSTIQRP